MTTKHTPTPWTYKSADKDGGMIICEPSGYLVAALPSAPAIEKEIANAAFIVRACNAHRKMLHALEMVRDADDDCKADGFPTMPPIARATIDSAIAEARGEQ